MRPSNIWSRLLHISNRSQVGLKGKGRGTVDGRLQYPFSRWVLRGKGRGTVDGVLKYPLSVVPIREDDKLLAHGASVRQLMEQLKLSVRYSSPTVSNPNAIQGSTIADQCLQYPILCTRKRVTVAHHPTYMSGFSSSRCLQYPS